MLAGPFTARIVGIGHVKCWRQCPRTGLVHEKNDVLDVIVMISGDDVEGCPKKLLLQWDALVDKYQSGWSFQLKRHLSKDDDLDADEADANG